MEPIKRLPVTRLQEINQAYRDRQINFDEAESMFMEALGVTDPEDRFKRIKVAFRIHPDAFRLGKIAQAGFISMVEIDSKHWSNYQIEADEIFYTYVTVSPYIKEHTVGFDREEMSHAVPGDKVGMSAFGQRLSDFSQYMDPSESKASMPADSSFNFYKNQPDIKIGVYLEGVGNIRSLSYPGRFLGVEDYDDHLTIHYDVNWLSEVEAPGDESGLYSGDDIGLYSGVSRRRRSIRRSPLRRSPRPYHRRSPLRRSPLRRSPVRRYLPYRR